MQSDNIVVVFDDFKKDNLNSTVSGNTMEDDDKECEPRATTSTATTVGASAANGLTNRKPYYGLTKLLVMKVALPHVGLLILMVLYIIMGAFVFKHLEQDQLRQSVILANNSLTLKKEQFLNKLQNIIIHKNGTNQDAVMEVQNFIQNLHAIYRGEGGRYVDRLWSIGGDPWTFDKSLFFGATTLTSIGYGTQAPTTTTGRLFCIIFTTFGLPLAVILVADLAKFISRFVVCCYTKWLMKKHGLYKFFCFWCAKPICKDGCDKNSVDKGDEEEQVAEFLWTNLENAKFVEVPALLMFILILIYVAIGALIFVPIEHWSFAEGFYFSIISILAIGFGDFTPKNETFIYISLFYVLFGLLLTTTCIDVVGIQYVNKIHNFGRRLQRTDPLLWLKAVQERRLRRMKRTAMMALFNTLTAVNRMKLDHSASAFDQSTAGNSIEANLALLNDLKQSKDPPSEPCNFRAESVSVFSVFLRWEPPLTGSTEDLHYLLNYRLSPLSSSTIMVDSEPFEWSNRGSRRIREKAMKINLIRHAPRKAALTVVEPVTDCFFEVSSLRSFSLYHFTLVAVNKYGRSGPVYTQEYTEPSSVPLNLRADQITDSSVTVCWDSPVKNKDSERQYIVHYTSNFERPVEEWQRNEVGATKVCTATQLNPSTRYAFTVSANHNGKLAIFSRSLQVLTKSASSMKKISVVYDGQTGRVNSNTVVAFEDNS